MIDGLENEPRLVIDVQLEPVAGSTFQPTGFPDLGAATFQRPGGPPSVLVESVQSMTNRLEEVGWNHAERTPVETVAKLPYVRVESADGAFLTSSRLEPHRLAAAYVRDAASDGVSGRDLVTARLGLQKERPLDWPQIYRAIFELDPFCLVHGVFFSDSAWHGNPKVRRAVSAVVEAHDAAPVISGGLKRDDVAFTATEGRGAAEGYGFVPFGRTEYTAREIVLTVVVDLAQIRGYGLDEDATRLLTQVALWEIASLLAKPFRLRTACDLETVSLDVRRPSGFVLPDAAALAGQIASSTPQFEAPGPRLAVWQPPKSSKDRGAEKEG
jgi:CRISPR-associated protein Csb1